MSKDVFSEFMDIIRKLRSEEGCPWDKEQTHESLKTCLIEECYETIEAIDNKDQDNLKEELGDILLQVAMHSAIAEEEGHFTVHEVIQGVGDKMIHRHPHVFGDVTVTNSDEVLTNWEEIKKLEKKNYNPSEELKAVPKAFPSVIRAEKVLKKTVKSGVPAQAPEELFRRASEGLKNLEKAMEIGEVDRISEKYGNLLLTFINISLILHINAENSLTNATNEFINRFVDVFALTESKGITLYDLSLAEQVVLWGDE